MIADNSRGWKETIGGELELQLGKSNDSAEVKVKGRVKN